jgi:hypothetical protein
MLAASGDASLRRRVTVAECRRNLKGVLADEGSPGLKLVKVQTVCGTGDADRCHGLAGMIPNRCPHAAHAILSLAVVDGKSTGPNSCHVPPQRDGRGDGIGRRPRQTGRADPVQHVFVEDGQHGLPDRTAVKKLACAETGSYPNPLRAFHTVHVDPGVPLPTHQMNRFICLFH